MSSRAGELLVAIQWEGGRVITRCLRLDERGAEVAGEEPLPVGKKVRLQFRGGRGHAVRTYHAEIFRQRDRSGFRLEFENTNRLHIAELLRLGRRAGIVAGEDRSPRVATPAVFVRPNPIVHVSHTRLRETFVILAHDQAARDVVNAEVRTGQVYIETPEPPEVGLQILLRVETEPDIAVYLSGRVEFRTQDPDGFGVRLDASPALEALVGR